MMWPLLFILLVVVPKVVVGQFDSLFHNHSLRIDYIHAGTAENEWYALDEMIAEPYWGGSKTKLIDTLRYGNYFFELTDKASGNMIYSRGYNTLFGEWQTTLEAKNLVRAFYESVVMPFPRRDAEVVFYSRNRAGIFDTVFRLGVDPNNYFIRQNRRQQWPVFELEVNAPVENAVDIVVLPDGYSFDEMGQFINDTRFFADALFSFEPFKSMRPYFNIRAVLASSPESGPIIPADSVWPNNLLSSSFYTFDSERYCMTMDHKKLRDIAANAPYDQIFILVNTEKYGGGGIYNFYSISSVNNRSSDKVIVHEFGHGFAALGDEYYDSSVAYSEFYNLDIEPYEPNLTTLMDFDRKWKQLLLPDTPVPTPDSTAYHNRTGVFEGGGYVARGMYRPAYDCLMKSLTGNVFCEVCNNAIIQMIRFYTD